MPDKRLTLEQLKEFEASLDEIVPDPTLSPSSGEERKITRSEIEAFFDGGPMIVESNPANSLPGQVPESVFGRPIPTGARLGDRVFGPEARPGVPLDRETGAPLGMRAKLGFLSSEIDGKAMLDAELKRLYGEGFESRVSGNAFIIPQPDPNSDDPEAQIDVLVDPERLEPGDLLDLSSEILPTVLSVAATMRGGMGNFIQKAIMAARGAIGAGVGRSVSDTAAREALGVDPENQIGAVELGAAEAVLDLRSAAVMGGAAMLGRPVLQKIVGPFAESPLAPHLQRVREAREMLRRRTGVEIPQSVGEASGSSDLIALEQVAEKLGAEKQFQALKAAKSEAERTVLESLVRIGDHDAVVGPLRPSEQIAQDIVDRARKAELDYFTARRELANGTIHDALEAAGGPTVRGRVQSFDAVGNALREAVQTGHRLFREESARLFGEFNKELAKANAAFGDGLGAAVNLKPRVGKLFKDLDRKITTNVKRVPKNEPITGPDTRPVVGEIEQVVNRKFLPASVRRWRNKVEGLLETPQPLETVLNLRSELGAEIAFGEGLTSSAEATLKKLRQTLTDSIDDMQNSLPTPELRKAHRAANDFYKSHVGEFQSPIIERILTSNRNSKSFVENADIVRRLARSEREYFDVKNLIIREEGGAEAFTTFRENLAAEAVDLATITSTSDLGAFKAALNKMPRKVREDVFGGKADAIIREITTAQKALKSSRINPNEFQDIVNEVIRDSDNASKFGKRLVSAIEGQVAKDKLFRENLVQRFVKGSDQFASIDARQFADSFLEVASEKEIASIMNKIGTGEQLMALRRETFERLLTKAADRGGKDGITAGLSDGTERTLTPKALAKELFEGKGSKNYQAILGDDVLRHLEAFIEVTSTSRGQFRDSSGGFARTAMMTSLLDGKLKNLRDRAKFKLLAFIVTNPATANWAASSRTVPQIDTFLRSIFATEAFQSTMLAEIQGPQAKARALDEMADAFGIDWLALGQQALDAASLTVGGLPQTATPATQTPTTEK